MALLVCVVAAPAHAASIADSSPHSQVSVRPDSISWAHDGSVNACPLPGEPVPTPTNFDVMLRPSDGLSRRLATGGVGAYYVDALGDGFALVSWWGCDGADQSGEYNLETQTFTPYETLPQAEPGYSFLPGSGAPGQSVIRQRDVFILMVEDSKVYRVNLDTGAMASAVIASSQLPVGGTLAMVGRASNGDFVWPAASSTCTNPKISRFTTAGAVTTSTAQVAGYLSTLDGTEVPAPCHRWLRPDSGRQYAMRSTLNPRGNHDIGSFVGYLGRHVAHNAMPGGDECCALVFNTATGEARKLPRSAGRRTAIHGITSKGVVWSVLNSQDNPTGALQLSSLNLLPLAVQHRWTSRSGGMVTAGYRLYETDSPAWVVRWYRGSWRRITPQKWATRGSLSFRTPAGSQRYRIRSGQYFSRVFIA